MLSRPEDLTLLLLKRRVTKQLLWILLHRGITECMKRSVKRLISTNVRRGRLENYGVSDGRKWYQWLLMHSEQEAKAWIWLDKLGITIRTGLLQKTVLLGTARI